MAISSSCPYPLGFMLVPDDGLTPSVVGAMDITGKHIFTLATDFTEETITAKLRRFKVPSTPLFPPYTEIDSIDDVQLVLEAEAMVTDWGRWVGAPVSGDGITARFLMLDTESSTGSTIDIALASVAPSGVTTFLTAPVTVGTSVESLGWDQQNDRMIFLHKLSDSPINTLTTLSPDGTTQTLDTFVFEDTDNEMANSFLVTTPDGGIWWITRFNPLGPLVYRWREDTGLQRVPGVIPLLGSTLWPRPSSSVLTGFIGDSVFTPLEVFPDLDSAASGCTFQPTWGLAGQMAVGTVDQRLTIATLGILGADTPPLPGPIEGYYGWYASFAGVLPGRGAVDIGEQTVRVLVPR